MMVGSYKCLLKEKYQSLLTIVYNKFKGKHSLVLELCLCKEVFPRRVSVILEIGKDFNWP